MKRPRLRVLPKYARAAQLRRGEIARMAILRSSESITAATKEAAETKIAKWTEALAKYTKCLVFVTSIGVLFSIWSLVYIYRQLRHMELAERPYIAIGPYQVLKLEGENTKHVFVNISNFGKLPGFISEYFFQVKSYDVLPSEPEYDIPDNGDDVATGGDPTHQKVFRSRLYVPFNPEWNQPFYKDTDSLVGDASKDLYVFGYVRYFDLVGESHKTSFCVKIKKDRLDWEGSVGGNSWNDSN